MNDKAPAPAQTDPEIAEIREFATGAIRRTIENVRAGELGSWPVIIGLIFISAFFDYKNSNFLSGSNLGNLITQFVPLATIAMGVVFVLLIAEIDLSVAFVSGFAGSVVVAEIVSRHGHFSGLVAIPIALAAGALYGMVQGGIVAYVGVPSFVVTLGGLLVAEGLVVKVVGSSPIYVNDKWVLDLSNYRFAHSTSWIIAIVVSVLYALAVSGGLVIRRRGGETRKLWYPLVKIAAVSVGMFAIVAWVNRARGGLGLPLAFVSLLVLYIFWDFIAKRTTFGRHVYAVGGNDEAARRAGINVPRIRLFVFMISGVMAALGGVMSASRSFSAVPGVGGDPLLMYAIASAVIGGTSLFGGRGHVKSAVLGALIIQMIANGCDLVGYSSATRFIVTALILLAAVTLDTVARKRQAAAGR
jgi:ABC-type xylose transport system, permease component